MDAFYIINSKNNEILLSKEFKSNESSLKLQIFLMEFNKIISNEKSPFICISDSLFIYLKDSLNLGIIYLAIISEDNLITSVSKILETINSTLMQAFDSNLSVELIRDNIIEIMLMIDQFLISGVPVFNEVNALSGLISPYNFKDKLTEKFIGKAKEYDTRTLLNFVRDTQTSYENFKYLNENIKNNYEVLFHFNDYLELSCDKNFSQLNKNIYSEIEVFSQIPYNIELNLLLNIPFNTLDCSVDETVITKKKDILKKKNLDCVMKHGNYILMQFVPYLTTQLLLPFKINVTSSSTNSNFNLNVQIELEAVRDVFYPLDDLNVKIYFPENFSNSNLSVSIGEFEFGSSNSVDSLKIKEKNASWNINRLDKASVATLKGQLVFDSQTNCSTNCVLVFSCKIDKFSVSGGSISKGTITKNPKNLEIGKKGRNFTIIKNLEIVF